MTAKQFRLEWGRGNGAWCHLAGVATVSRLISCPSTQCHRARPIASHQQTLLGAMRKRVKECQLVTHAPGSIRPLERVATTSNSAAPYRFGMLNHCSKVVG